MNLQSWLNRLRFDLGDRNGRRWPDGILLAYLNEGLCELFEVRPELFARTCKVPLTAGAEQCIDPCCIVLCVLGIYDQNDEKIAAVDDASEAETDYPLNKPSCMVGMVSDTMPRSVRKYEGSRHCFDLQPPITNCDDLYAKVEVACRPDPLTLDFEGDIEVAVGCRQQGPILHYALSMARRNPASSPVEIRLAGEDYQIWAGHMRNREATAARRQSDCDD